MGPLAVFGADEKDGFEPDDSPAEAKIWQPGDYDPPARNFHRPDDEDWVKIYLVGSEHFILDALQLGTMADVQVQVFFQTPDGFVEPIGPPINRSERGAGIQENVDLYMGGDRGEQGPPQGFYFIRYTPGNPDAFGPDSHYRFVVTSPTLENREQRRAPSVSEGSGNGGAANGNLICVAADRLYTNLPPRGARCVVEGQAERVFTNQNIYFSLPAGVYNVYVTADEGYEPIEDPAQPEQTKNATNEFYGNPKTRVVVASGWDIAVFQMAPYGKVTGAVRDGQTGAFVDSASIVFKAVSGLLTNLGLSFTSFQDNRYYVPDWLTGADGQFPNDVFIPTTNWHLFIDAPGYQTSKLYDAVTQLQLAESRNLGTLYLEPLDGDDDGLADSWEQEVFGSTEKKPGEDEDGDGKSNKDEYLDGTNPIDDQDYFGWNEPSFTNFTLSWRSAPGRTYKVKGLSNLKIQEWSDLSAPLMADVNQTNLSWSETNALSQTTRYFQVERVDP